MTDGAQRATPRTRVAFLGLGAIGRPMAKRLAERPELELSLWNRTGARADSLATESGARACDTPAAAASDAEVVITCLPTSTEVASLLEGAGGLLEAMRRGTVLVDCTSGDPGQSRAIAARLAARGVHFLDAPVSGGTTGAERGLLTVLCGGDAPVLERVRPVLAAFGRKIVHCGPVGTGHAVKAVNQGLLAVHIWSLAEGLAALSKAGVSAAVALEVISASSGRSNTSEHLFPERVVTRAFPRTFRLALLEKDVAICGALLRAEGVPAPILQLTAELFRAARTELGEEADHVEAAKVVERMAGTEIR